MEWKIIQYFIFYSGGSDRVYTVEISPYATQLHFIFAQEGDSGQYACNVGPLYQDYNITFEGTCTQVI